MVRFKNLDFFNKKRSRNKYNATKCKRDGYIFDSLKEGKEYDNLKIREYLNEIKDLKVHPRYPIFVNDTLICHVVLDFEYYDNKKKCIRYIDVKGFDKKTNKYRVTGDSILRRKLVEAQMNIKVEYL